MYFAGIVWNIFAIVGILYAVKLLFDVLSKLLDSVDRFISKLKVKLVYPVAIKINKSK